MKRYKVIVANEACRRLLKMTSPEIDMDELSTRFSIRASFIVDRQEKKIIKDRDGILGRPATDEEMLPAKSAEESARYRKYTTSKEIIERLIIIGPMAERNSVMEELHNDGWNLPSIGPYTDRKLFPNCDPTRFKFTAERAIDQE